jgi:hypothetical protein
MIERKRGQYYLISAIVISMILIGYAVISNYSKIIGHTKTYDLAEELEIESANVLDYGIYNEDIGIEQMQSLLEGFIEAYSEIGEIEELYFIFGNADQIIFMGYQQLQDKILIRVAVDEDEYHPLQIGKKEVGHKAFTSEEDIEEVKVVISEDEYEFELEEGENFYFILSQVIGGEEYVEVR